MLIDAMKKGSCLFSPLFTHSLLFFSRRGCQLGRKVATKKQWRSRQTNWRAINKKKGRCRCIFSAWRRRPRRSGMELLQPPACSLAPAATHPTSSASVRLRVLQRAHKRTPGPISLALSLIWSPTAASEFVSFR